MRCLIVGASSQRSIGYHIGEHLRVQGHDVKYVSRSGRLDGYKYDVTSLADLIFDREKPELVIHGAGGAFLKTEPLGACTRWSEMKEHIAAKSLGTIMLLDAAVRVGSVRHFVMLGGRATFGDEKMAAYAAGNGALWSLTQFANQHIAGTKYYYLDMPIVIGTKNAEGLIAAGAHTAGEYAQAIPIEKVIQTFDEIIAGKIEPGRVML